MEVRNYAEIAFEKHKDAVFRLAFARTGNRADAEDILQEVFLRYLKRGKKAESETHELALLLRAAANCSNSLFRSAWHRRTTALEDGLSADFPHKDTLEAVLSLPQKYRTVVHLHYYCGYSVEEIAEILKAKPSTVKSQLFRAREKLKIALKGETEDV